MKGKIIVIFMVSILFVVNALAAQFKEIILKDGSVIYGNIVGVKNGQYKIQTRDMGVVNIAEEKVVSIKSQTLGKDMTNKDASRMEFTKSDPADPYAVQAGIDALKRGISNDQGTMKAIADLQNDPDFMAALEDPGIMSAVSSGDIGSLTSNPKFLKLLDKPIISEMKSKIE